VHRQVNHHAFVVEREFTHSPALVFSVWTHAEGRREWFRGPDDSRILDIVPDERILTAFMTSADGVPITASLATLEFKTGDYGTQLKYTEQIAFLDAYAQDWHDHLQTRIEGSEALFDAFEYYLETHQQKA
jgi:uncharacterized protein YndB with AHSA1/START domain